MGKLLDFFVQEASDYLDKFEAELGGDGRPDADRLRRIARALRGSARMADQEAIAEAAGAVQDLAGEVATGRLDWEPALKEKLDSALAEIRQMVNSVHAPPPDIDDRARALADRLGHRSPRESLQPQDERFRRYLGSELRGLAADIAEAIEVLERDPRNREPLKRLLRRIRPLRGVEAVSDMGALEPALAAVEEVILRIADMSATVGPGHLVLFRRARQALDDVSGDLIRGAEPTEVVEGQAEFEDLKEQLLDTAAEREIAWVTEFFYDGSGPHVERCPMADRGAGSWEAFFSLESTRSLDTVDGLRTEMVGDDDVAHHVGQRLAFTLRELRERAVTFGHAGFGHVARRAAAAVRAQLDEAPSRLQTLAHDLSGTIEALRAYVETSEPEERAQSLREAEASLQVAATPDEAAMIPIELLTYDPEEALARALQLRETLAQALSADTPDLRRANALLEEVFGHIQDALARSDTSR